MRGREWAGLRLEGVSCAAGAVDSPAMPGDRDVRVANKQ